MLAAGQSAEPSETYRFGRLWNFQPFIGALSGDADHKQNADRIARARVDEPIARYDVSSEALANARLTPDDIVPIV